MPSFKISKNRTIDAEYVDELCKGLIGNNLYHCLAPASLFSVFAYLSSRQIPFQIQYHVGTARYVFAIKIAMPQETKKGKLVDVDPVLFMGRNQHPHIAAGLALVAAIEHSR